MQNITPIGLLSAAIRRERERLNLSVTELAKRAGIAKSTLSQLEAGSGNPQHGNAVGVGDGAGRAGQPADFTAEQAGASDPRP